MDGNGDGWTLKERELRSLTQQSWHATRHAASLRVKSDEVRSRLAFYCAELALLTARDGARPQRDTDGSDPPAEPGRSPAPSI
jgi:hypothetical protein